MTMKTAATASAALFACALLLVPTPAQGQAPEVTVQELCDGPVDPYNAGMERTLFLQAAGVDTELAAD